MDSGTMEQLKQVLLDRWRRIGNNAEREREREREEARTENREGQAEIIDIAQALEQQGRDSSLAEQERRELIAVERALAKIATGTFGVCEDCAEEIPTRRLLVLPEARLCAHCQAFEEKQSRSRTLRAVGR